MLQHSSADLLPNITVGETEEHLLTMLATGARLAERSQDVASVLLSEMERAKVVPDTDMPTDVVRMNSRVEFELDDGKRQVVELVYPKDANIDEKRISVLTPIGAALIGLSSGQTMMMRGRDGRPHKLRVISVQAPAIPTQ
jgi:regulator of nucleoside diphosphate kinase